MVDICPAWLGVASYQHRAVDALHSADLCGSAVQPVPRRGARRHHVDRRLRRRVRLQPHLEQAPSLLKGSICWHAARYEAVWSCCRRSRELPAT